MEASVYSQIKKNWDCVAKPLDSMGRFEELTAKIGVIQNSVYPKLEKTALYVFCADNGIVEEGVSQSGMEVTAACAKNIAGGKSSAAVMAKALGLDVITVDIGIACESEIDGVINRKIRAGSRNFLKEPALTEDELQKALAVGKELARDAKKRGYDAVCIGEMGIGNTTTCAAAGACLLGLPVDLCVGRGAGLSDQGLVRKKQVIDSAIKKYDLYNADVKKILQCVGGYDLAGMTGLFLGAKECGLPVILDGVVSLVAALAAARIEKDIGEFLIPSHKSREPVAVKALEELGLTPVIDADMALGEGSGAVMMTGLLRTALCVYDKAVRFEASGVEQYERESK